MTVAVALDPGPAPDPSYQPAVAIGLRALTLALKARGDVAAQSDAFDLCHDAVDMLPAETGLHRALVRFERGLGGDQRVAGAELMDFLSAWRGDLAVERTETALRDMAPAHWGERKDCGHE